MPKADPNKSMKNVPTLEVAGKETPQRTWQLIDSISKQISAQNKSQTKEPFLVNEKSDRIHKTYETIRNSVEYSEENMIMRRAIDRFLRRSFYRIDGKALGHKLVSELTLSGYIKDGSIDKTQLKEIVRLLFAYQLFLKHTDVSARKDYEQYIGIVSGHLQDVIADNQRLLSVINSSYQYVLEHYPQDQIDQVRVPIYISVERIIYKSDDATIRSRLFRMAFGHNLIHDPAKAADDYRLFVSNVREAQTSAELYEVSARVRKASAGLLILSDILLKTKDPKRLSNPKELELAVEKSSEKLYAQASKRLSRAIWRSLVFLILTKAVVGLAIEIPYDLLVHDEIILLPLLINLLFPPIYLLFSSSLILMPGKENTQRVSRLIHSIFFDNHTPKLDEFKDNDDERIFERLFNLIYSMLSLGVFGGLTWLLIELDFSAVSLAIFFIYFSSVSYFSFRITNGVRELKARTRKGSSFLSTSAAIINTPFVRLGQWLSSRYQSFNLVVFVFDFIIEAPLKTVSLAVRRWNRFIQDKQDESL